MCAIFQLYNVAKSSGSLRRQLGGQWVETVGDGIKLLGWEWDVYLPYKTNSHFGSENRPFTPTQKGSRILIPTLATFQQIVR